jgi:hypothetical protein
MKDAIDQLEALSKAQWKGSRAPASTGRSGPVYSKNYAQATGGGEGSRGGKIIGHTAGGDPIYESAKQGARRRGASVTSAEVRESLKQRDKERGGGEDWKAQHPRGSMHPGADVRDPKDPEKHESTAEHGSSPSGPRGQAARREQKFGRSLADAKEKHGEHLKQAHAHLDKIESQLDKPGHAGERNINWGHVGDMGEVVKHLHSALGKEEGEPSKKGPPRGAKASDVHEHLQGQAKAAVKEMRSKLVKEHSPAKPDWGHVGDAAHISETLKQARHWSGDSQEAEKSMDAIDSLGEMLVKGVAPGAFSMGVGKASKKLRPITDKPFDKKAQAKKAAKKHKAGKAVHPTSEAQRKWAFAAEQRGELPKGKALEWSRRAKGGMSGKMIGKGTAGVKGIAVPGFTQTKPNTTTSGFGGSGTDTMPGPGESKSAESPRPSGSSVQIPTTSPRSTSSRGNPLYRSMDALDQLGLQLVKGCGAMKAKKKNGPRKVPEWLAKLHAKFHGSMSGKVEGAPQTSLRPMGTPLKAAGARTMLPGGGTGSTAGPKDLGKTPKPMGVAMMRSMGSNPTAEELRKGLWSFMDGGGETGDIPPAMLYDFLKAFVCEAYEDEKHEGAGMEHSQIHLDAGETIYDHWAKCVMGELVKTLPKSKNLRAAVKKHPTTQGSIATMLKESGVVKPESQSYIPTDRDSMAAMGGSFSGEAMAFSQGARPWMGEELEKATPLQRSEVPSDQRPVQIEDDRQDPFTVLSQLNKARMQQAFMVADREWRPNVNGNCPIHGYRDLTKTMNLQNPYGRCCCS